MDNKVSSCCGAEAYTVSGAKGNWWCKVCNERCQLVDKPEPQLTKEEIYLDMKKQHEQWCKDQEFYNPIPAEPQTLTPEQINKASGLEQPFGKSETAGYCKRDTLETRI